ncbi:flavin reductase family protein [Desulforamulus profundi]|uniref:flavin reductase family protein n=1 Tax=Desulforamulus profundi TaxID=1383067 RepID=UPI001EE5ADBB|nr:flavin reductase family protein [Desulforamulus profundi]
MVRPGGILVLSVPAFNWLWGRHDDLNNHYRRYDFGELIHSKNCFSEANRYILVQDQGVEQPDIESSLGMPALNSVLYLVGSTRAGKVNAMCCSSVTQVTYCSAKVAVAVNKNNLTHDYIKESGVFSLSALGQNQGHMAHYFGRNSGRQMNKFASFKYKRGKTGSPIIEGCPDYYDCQVDHRATIDLDTHTLFVDRVMDASSDSEEPLLTYRDYARDVRNLINDPNMSQRTV